MRAARRIVLGLGCACSVSLLALAAGAETLHDRAPQTASVSVLPSESLHAVEAPAIAASEEAVTVPQPVALAAPAANEPAIDAPDLPTVTVVIDEPIARAEAPALDLPLPPDASVTITAADRLQTALVAKLAALDEIAPRLSRREREALAAYYADARPLWVKGDLWTDAAKAVMQRLKAAAEDGLDPTDYPVPALAAARSTTAEDWAEAELKLSAAAILYARDARGGRIDPSRLSQHITPKLDLPGAESVLGTLAAARDAGAALAAYNPPHEGYRALKAKLAQLRASRPGTPMVRVPQGPALRVGMRDARVPLIRARFNLGPAGSDQNAYDERVASAVAAFQKEKGLPANGVLTAQTIAALGARSAAGLEGDLVANMERWRWLPAELGQRHIAVNIPEYRLKLMDGDRSVHETRVIVGKQESPTPIFSDTMEQVIVNPSWTVPPSIMKKEFLPGLAADPLYAERRGYKVIRRGNRISVQQPPGDRNALGYVKFIFPNDHAVYLHDTPNRNLFSAGRRAFSHGCVRVENPFRLAEAVLSTEGAWSEPKLKALIGKGERYIRVKNDLPVHLTYFTLVIDEQGQMRTFDDLYGFHKKVKAALGYDA
ncbi:MAG TPA: L,D-transpeptidase family protein [Microvirga sp.]|jgi:murein L,D-transpeptidase YcbB/YkuD